MASNAQKLGGYSCKFVSEPPESYICKICTSVAKDPQQMDCCGKVYCGLCLTEHKKHSNKCPQCREEGNSFSDKRGEKLTFHLLFSNLHYSCIHAVELVIGDRIICI